MTKFGPPWGHMGRQDSPNETFDVYNLGKLLYWFLSSGVRLYREYYDRPQYDLRKEGAEHLVYFAYEVMEKSINEDPSRLYLTAAEMRKDIQKLIVFVETEGRYLDCALVQACAFCRIGSYQWQFVPAIHFDNNDSRDKFNYRTAHFYGLTFDLDGRGTNVSTHPVLLIGKCGHCGNVQQFRLDKEFKDGAEWKNLPKPA